MLLGACQTAPPVHGPSAVLPGPASAAVVELPGAARFALEPRSCEVRVLAYRAGPLARFGHDHVIVGRARGEIAAGDTAAASGFRVEIPLDSLEVDPPAARAEEGVAFAEPVSAQARDGTRAHMLGAAGLDAARYPFIRIESVALLGPRWGPTVRARVTLRGATRELRFPAAVFQSGDTLTVIAGFRLAQSDFGIVPYSVLGGGLRVRDALDIRVRLVARRAPAQTR